MRRSCLLSRIFVSLLSIVFSAPLSSALFAQAAGRAADSSMAAGTVSQSETGPSPLDEAEASIGKKDWKAAESRLGLWLTGHPSDARALFDAGYVADAQDRNDDAEKLYVRAITADAKSFEARLSLGLLLARTGRPDDAHEELERATELDPGVAGVAAKARAWRALARIDAQDDPETASDELLEALKLTPETPEDTLLAAQLAEKAGEDAAAEAAYRKVLAGSPGLKQAQIGLAHTLIAQKRYAEAEATLRAALEKAPDDPTLTAQLATALVAQDKDEALPVVKKLYEQHPKDPAIARMLAQVEADAGEFADSDKMYSNLLVQFPLDADLLTAHGQNLIRLKNYPGAYSALSRATELDPNNGDAWGGLAFAAVQTHEPKMALHALTMRSKYLPENPTTYFLWATTYDTLHVNRSAVSYYHQFLASAAGKFPDQEWQARQRLAILDRER